MVLSSQAECEARAEGKGMRGIGSILEYGQGRKEEPPLASWSQLAKQTVMSTNKSAHWVE